MKDRIKTRLKANRGVAALLVVSAFALLFIALVIGLSAVSLREQRQAGDIDQTNRANAIAESGITDAFSMLDNNPGYREPTCTQKLDSNGNGWTCRTITTTPGQVEGVVDADESDIIRADKAELENPDGTKTPVRYATSIELSYCNAADKCDLSPNPFATSLYPTLPPSFDSPAMLELSMVYWRAVSADNNQVAGPEDMKVKTFLVAPDLKDGSPLHTAYQLQSKCDGTGDYKCHINIDTASALGVADIENYRMIIKLKARYNGSHYQMIFKRGSDVVPVPAVNFVVDVTAKSGNVYRRMIGRRKITQTVSQGIFDNALFANANICKNLTVDKDLKLVTSNTCE